MSNRSGKRQVWIRYKNGNEKQITHFEGSETIKDLSTAINSKLILFTKNNRINIINKAGDLIFDSSNYSKERMDNPILDVKNNRFIYRVLKNDKSYIESRKLTDFNKKIFILEANSIRPCIKGSCLYYFKDNDSLLYLYFPKSNTSTPIVNLANIKEIEDWDIYDENNIIYLEQINANNAIPDYAIATLNLHSEKRTY